MTRSSRRSFLAGAGATAGAATLAGLTGAFSIGTPAYASDRAREQATDPAADPATAGLVDVQLLNITDFHGNLRTPTSAADGWIPDPADPTGQTTINVGGVAYIAAHVARLRRPRNSIFWSVGDDWSGGEPAETKLMKDEGAVEALNRLGLDFATLGNHEFDYGVDYLDRHMIHGEPWGVAGRDSSFPDSTGRTFRGVAFPYLSANMVSATTGKPYFQPYNIRWVVGPNGRRYPIAFIHLTLDHTPTGSTSYEPKLVGYDDIETANRYAKLLKARGYRAIVISIHDGAQQKDNWHAPINGSDMATGPALELAAKVDPDIAAIVTGHWHWWFNAMLPGPDGRVRPVVEASHAGQLINEITLKLDPRTGAPIRELTVSTNHPVTLDVPPDPALERIVDYWSDFADRKYAEPAGRVVADITKTIDANGSSQMGDLAADLLLWSSRQHRGGEADFAIVPVRPPTGSVFVHRDITYAKGAHAGDADGVVLWGETFEALGYDNPVLTVTYTGAQIKAWLEQQWQLKNGSEIYAPFAVSDNVRATYDLSQPLGNRVDPQAFLIDGTPLDLAATYRVAGLGYDLIGADGYSALTGFAEPFRGDRDHDAFLAYLRENSPLRPSPLGRITLRGSAAVTE